MRTGSVICIVDDDEDVRESIGAFFRSAGVAVKGFESAEALLASPALVAMDILITDLHMSGMDGLDLQRELTRLGRHAPVILMTAFPTPEAREMAETLGVSLFVEKPVDPEALLAELEALLAA